jgi:hypothetical protein
MDEAIRGLTAAMSTVTRIVDLARIAYWDRLIVIHGLLHPGSL